MARYEVYIWDKSDIEDYEDAYGEGSWERDSDKASCVDSVMQYGTKIGEFDVEEEASTKLYEECKKRSPYGSAFGGPEGAVWDTVEHYWFN